VATVYGPLWLPLDTQWPTWSPTNVLSIQTEEATDSASDFDSGNNMEQPQTHGPRCVNDASQYSQLSNLLSMSYDSVIYSLRHSTDKILGPVTAKELSTAWIQSFQSQVYTKEIINLKEKSGKQLLLF